MRKKIILLIGMLFLLCGCSAEVNLNITEEGIEETVSINYMADQTVTKEQVYSSFREFVPVKNDVIVTDLEPDVKRDDVEYYNRTVTDLGSGYNFKYNYKFDFKEYANSKTLKQGFKSAFVNQDTKEKTLTLSTDSSGNLFINQYPSLTSVVVNITTDYEVLECNGQSAGNRYTWTFTPGDNNKNIYIKLKTGEKEVEINKEPVINNSNSDDKDEEDSVDKAVDKYPWVFVLLGLVGFFIIIIIVSKVSRAKYE